MKTLLAILAVATLPLTAHAQIMKCVGAGGRVEFAAACPPGTKAQSTGIRNAPEAAPAGPQKSAGWNAMPISASAGWSSRNPAKKSGEKKPANCGSSDNLHQAKRVLLDSTLRPGLSP
ncbi:MAG: DUF4124 domain-containing protein [Aquincola sp.]|nr:DUF4124 domain-containing protein [Aquincola sp.]